MDRLLDNPAYYALCGRDAALGSAAGEVRFFNEAVSPFIGFSNDYEKGFDDLHETLPSGRRILYASPRRIDEPKGWKIAVMAEGLQFVFDGPRPEPGAHEPSRLAEQHIPEMIELTSLTKPGPFSKRTIEFGNYFGIFQDGRLASMAGHRLHVDDYTEISAVCTHPDFLGKGYAASLLEYHINLILDSGQIPFLHVRADNDRAIKLYERLGFRQRGPMNFYFMKNQKAS